MFHHQTSRTHYFACSCLNEWNGSLGGPFYTNGNPHLYSLFLYSIRRGASTSGTCCSAFFLAGSCACTAVYGVVYPRTHSMILKSRPGTASVNHLRSTLLGFKRCSRQLLLLLAAVERLGHAGMLLSERFAAGARPSTASLQRCYVARRFSAPDGDVGGGGGEAALQLGWKVAGKDLESHPFQRVQPRHCALHIQNVLILPQVYLQLI